jgi:hypothetical protein
VDELLIVGDSFCVNRTSPASWVNILKNLYPKSKITGKGFSGQSYWHQRRWFLENFSKNPENTSIIFCHTSALRLPCFRDVPITPWVLSIDDPSSKSNELLNYDEDNRIYNLARSFYSSELYDERFYIWTNEKWYHELSTLTKNFSKVIHLFGFDFKEDKKPMLQKNSILCTTLLRSLSVAELGCNESMPLSMVFGGPDPRVNHFNSHNNIQLALFLKNVLDDTKLGSIVKIKNLSEWDLKDKNLVENFTI